jgi:hypothetical protein
MVRRHLLLLKVLEVRDFTSNHFRGGHIFDVVNLESSMFSCSKSGDTIGFIFVLSLAGISKRFVDNSSSTLATERQTDEDSYGIKGALNEITGAIKGVNPDYSIADVEGLKHGSLHFALRVVFEEVVFNKAFS